MDLCLAEKKNKEEGEKNQKCNKPTKYIIKLENEEEYSHPRCGIHSRNIDDKNKIPLDEFMNQNKENDDDNKLNITIDNSDKEKKESHAMNKDKKELKRPCLQYVMYLISKDDNDLCQYEDCQFAHNIKIIYT